MSGSTTTRRAPTRSYPSSNHAQVLGYGRACARSLLGHGGEGQNLRSIATRSVQPRFDRVREPVLGVQENSAALSARATIWPPATDAHPLDALRFDLRKQCARGDGFRSMTVRLRARSEIVRD